MESEKNVIKYEDIKELLNYMFPSVNDWVCNIIISDLTIDGRKIRSTPGYISEKLKLIVLYDYYYDISNFTNSTFYAIHSNNTQYKYSKADYRIVNVPSYLSLSRIKKEFDKKDYFYIRNIITPKFFKNNPIIKTSKSVIHPGNTVKVLDMDFDEEIEYELVSSSESDIAQNKISIESHIGKALLGKKVNEEIIVKVPDGTIKFKILKIA